MMNREDQGLLRSIRSGVWFAGLVLAALTLLYAAGGCVATTTAQRLKAEERMGQTPPSPPLARGGSVRATETRPAAAAGVKTRARQRDKCVLYASLALTRPSRELDLQALTALRALPERFTHVMLMLPAWQQAPDALNTRIVRAAVWHIRRQGRTLIIGRDLWPRWPRLSSPWPPLNAIEDASTYAAAIAWIKADGARLNCETAIDAEPYGSSAVMWIKPRDAIPDLAAMAKAIEQATAAAGQVDYVYPCVSRNPNSYVLPLGTLGKTGLDHTTYRARADDPAPDRGTHVIRGVYVAAKPTLGQLTPAQAVRIRGDCWWFVDRIDLLETVRQTLKRRNVQTSKRRHVETGRR